MTITDNFKKIAEKLESYVGEKWQIIITSKGLELQSRIIVENVRIEEGPSEIGDTISFDGEGNDFTIYKKDVIKFENFFFQEEIIWRKDGFQIEFKNGTEIDIDILD